MANGAQQGKITNVKLEPGIMVTPHVRLTEPLGEGAMGAVWVAEHLTLHTDVAVKFISEQLARDNPEIVARFEREASVAAQIKSPYVVQTFDHGVTDDGTPYIVMELLEGESLEERIQRSGPLPLEETSQIISQVARALRRAHDKGIVHRDIKPDNIFVTLQDDGVFCKILDFGIAKQAQLPKMGRLTNAGIMIGTPEYMSPEQVLSSKDVDFHTDLWALAVTAYEALTARLPFEAEALGELCVKLLSGEFLPPSHYRSELPSTVDDWFRIALNRDLAQRLDGARELSTTFMHALDLAPHSILQHTLPGSRRIETITGLTPAVSQPGAMGPASSQPGAMGPASSQPGAVGPASSQPGAMGPASSQPGAPDAAIPGKSPTLSGTFASINAERIPAWRQPKWLAAAAAVLAVAGLGTMLLATSNQPSPSSPAATISDSASSENPAQATAEASSHVATRIGAAPTAEPASPSTSSRAASTPPSSSATVASEPDAAKATEKEGKGKATEKEGKGKATEKEGKVAATAKPAKAKKAATKKRSQPAAPRRARPKTKLRHDHGF